MAGTHHRSSFAEITENVRNSTGTSQDVKNGCVFFVVSMYNDLFPIFTSNKFESNDYNYNLYLCS